MNAATAVLWTAAAVMFGFGPAFCIALAVSERRDRRADERSRAEQGRQVDAEWLALLAETETTAVYDQLACEQIERAEGWVQ
jgi:hypothetical protein